MLSIENPSCSSKDSDLACGHENHQAHLPNFSIRDYVFKSRSKDVRVNWPFHEQLLQLCLDNGITDLLPPLQSPSLVRAYCFRKQVVSELIENKTVFENRESEKNVELDSLSPLKPQHSLPEERRKPNPSSMTSHDHSEGISGEQLKKMSKLTTKSDLLSNPISVSDPMSSKGCPVCKSFTSSSNTTLNAHIDQCLSSDQSKLSNAIKDVGELQKHRVQPRKKRLMVDIYKTALHCTLEDLDRRNGTNWAVTLAPLPPADDGTFAPSSPANVNNLEMKRTKSDPLNAVREINLGDIYVDSNGKKLLILSKFDGSPSSVSRNNFMLKKKILKQKGSEFMHNNPQKRKMRRFKEFKGQNEAATEKNHISEAYQEKEESISHMLNSHDQVKRSKPSILGHWVCSKRSDLSRKLDHKDISKESKSRKLPAMCSLSELAHSSIQRNHAPNSLTSSKAVTFPNPKDINVLFNSEKNIYNGKKISSQSSNLNSNFLSESCHPSSKISKSLILKKSGFSRTCISLEEIDKVEGFISPQKIKKQRSMLGCNKWRGEKNTAVDVGIDDSTEDFGLASSGANEASKTHQSNVSDNQEKESSEVMEHISRDERCEELSAETTYNKKSQCGDAAINWPMSQNIQISDDQAEQILQDELNTDTFSFEEPNPNDGDTVFENTQENSSTIVRVESNQDYGTILSMDSSASVSPSSPVDVNIKDSEIGQLAKDDPLHNELSSSTLRKDNKVPGREPSCSCSESLSRESQFSNQTRKTTVSNLFIKPPAFSPLQVFPSTESHTESVITTDSSQSSMNVSTPCSRVSSLSNPILRLMGKDLVVRKEEMIVPCTSSCNLQPKFISFGFPTNVGFISYDNPYDYQFQTMGNHQIPLQPQQRYNMYNPSSETQNHGPKPIIRSNQAREVIVIDDDSHGLRADQRANFSILPQPAQTPNIMTSQKMFACYPLHNPYQRGTSECSFTVPSPSSLYFSSNLR